MGAPIGRVHIEISLCLDCGSPLDPNQSFRKQKIMNLLKVRL